jgi:hypothetical protein
VPGASEIRLWSLNEVADTLGNAMSYHYVEDTGDKSYRLDHIAYTRNDGESVAPQSEVRFLYEARPDTRSSFLAGAELAMTKRLAAIETWTDTGSGPALVKSYDLTYETSPATSRSRLTAVTECDPDDNCLQPVELGWPAYSPSWITETNHNLSVPIYDYTGNTSGGLRKNGEFADVNGDGFDDWVENKRHPNGTAVATTYLGSAEGWTSAPEWTLPCCIYNYTNSTSVGERKTGELVDLNADGLPDWVQAFKRPDGSEARSTYLNTGNGWSLDANYELPQNMFNYTSSTTSSSRRTGLFVDVNGDGLTDWIQSYRSTSGSVTKLTYINTGSSWLLDAAFPPPDVVYDSDTPERVRGEFLDINGDGLPDWVRSFRRSDGSDQRITWLNTGSGWVVDTDYRAPDFVFDYTSLTGGDRRRGRFVDVNGDGLPDWIRSFRGTNATVYKTTWLNTGRSWELSSVYAPAEVVYDYYEPNTDRGDFLDVNGDGLVDWVRAFRRSNGDTFQQTRLNTGSGWQVSVDYKAGFLLFDMQKTGASPWRHGELVDVNGDGLLDMVRAYRRNNSDFNKSTHVAQSVQPDLLLSITDSLGRVSTIEYAPLTDGAVYTKDGDAVFPVVDIQAPLYVVKSVSSDDGVGGQRVTSYSYAGAKVHVQGRGFRGFRQMTATDQQTGIVTTTEYSQVFPTTAQVLSSVKTLADGATTIKTLANTWDALSLNNGDTVWPYVAASVSEDYEPNDGPANTPVVTRTAVATFDSFGNPTELETETVGGSETFTETTENTYTNDTTNWFLGLLTRSEVTRTRPAP